MIRVLVVDDSSTMRRLIAAALSADPELEVVGEAGDPLQAREAIKALNPDVITLDVEMPNMNGLDFLERLMRLRPMPVVMVSTLTARGTEATLTALEFGAVDCVEKPGGVDSSGFHRLAENLFAPFPLGDESLPGFFGGEADLGGKQDETLGPRTLLFAHSPADANDGTN